MTIKNMVEKLERPLKHGGTPLETEETRPAANRKRSGYRHAPEPLMKVIPVRLSASHWRQLQEEAEELGIWPSTLARMWIVKCLREESHSRGGNGEGEKER